MQETPKQKWLGRALLVSTILFISVGLSTQVGKMWINWSVEGFSIVPIYFNLGIQILAYIYGRDIGNKVLWMPAVACSAFSLLIVGLFYTISCTS